MLHFCEGLGHSRFSEKQVAVKGCWGGLYSKPVIETGSKRTCKSHTHDPYPRTTSGEGKKHRT
jgi:hypothetical protein